MDPDELAIRSQVKAWMRASADGDLPRVLALMDDEVIFIGPARPPMRGKQAFAAASTSMAGKVRVEGSSDIQEVRVFGDWAYVWAELTIVMHPADGSAPARRGGPGLSVWRRNGDGAWVIFRDANMTTSQEETAENARTTG